MKIMHKFFIETDIFSCCVIASDEAAAVMKVIEQHYGDERLKEDDDGDYCFVVRKLETCICVDGDEAMAIYKNADSDVPWNDEDSDSTTET